MAADLLAEVMEFARRLVPQLTVVVAMEPTSFDDASIELRDNHVLWWIVRERSALRLVAAPEWDSKVWYDADLLRRLIGSPQRTPAAESARTESVADLVEQLEQLRGPVAAAFNEHTWETTRRQLLDLGRRRDAELFGRPYPAPK